MSRERPSPVESTGASHVHPHVQSIQFLSIKVSPLRKVSVHFLNKLKLYRLKLFLALYRLKLAFSSFVVAVRSRVRLQVSDEKMPG